MIKFNEYPYHRLDVKDIACRMKHHTQKIKEASTVGQAYLELVETDFLDKIFSSYATISEAGNTNNSYDKFYLGEEEFFNQVKPQFELLIQERNEAVLSSPFNTQLRRLMGDEFFDNAQMRKQTVSQEVLALMHEENQLSQKYSTLTSRLSIEVDGRTMTMPEINKFAQSPQREVRQRYARLGEQAMLQIAEELDALYDSMLKIRTEIAHKTGFDSYTDYCLCKHGRTSYGRKEIEKFAKNVETYIVPIVCEMVSKQEKRLGHEVKSYDEGTLFRGKDIKVAKDVIPAFEQIFSKLSPETKVFYDELCEREFFDLALREGKTNGAYSNYMPLCSMPFIFETYNATAGAVKTFAHECGHGLNSFLHRGEPVLGTCVQSSEICETHSMSMELFIWKYLDEIIAKEDVDCYQYRQLKDSLAFIPYGTAIDQFQTIVYDNPKLTPEERRQVWKDLEKRFLPWRKYEKGLFLDEGRAWQRQIHVMKWPFYYIDYVLAQVCALQFWALDLDNHEKSWNAYLKLMKNSGRYSFTKIIELVGLSTPFEDDILADISKKAQDFAEHLCI